MLFQSGAFWYICSGGLIESLDGTPGHFWTANHCISTASEAATLETYFLFTTPCPPHGDPTTDCDYANAFNSVSPASNGATIVDTSPTTDFTLLMLGGAPPAGTIHLPYSTTPVANTDGVSLYRISYPAGAPQAYSEHVVDAVDFGCGAPGDFMYSKDVIGATEGGSSGSTVANQLGQIVGQLYGSCAANNDDCDTVANRTYDGAFAATWEQRPLVRQALAQEAPPPEPEEVVLASYPGLELAEDAMWRTSFDNDGSYDNLDFVLAGNNGDGDLYVKLGSAPTTSDYDCAPYLYGTDETCTFDLAQEGTYHVMVHAYWAFTDASLTISTWQISSCPDADGDDVCDDDDICPNDPDDDLDQDGICGNEDNCPNDSNPDQLDDDGDDPTTPARSTTRMTATVTASATPTTPARSTTRTTPTATASATPPTSAPASTTTPTVTATAWRTAATSAPATTLRATPTVTACATAATPARSTTRTTATATASATPMTSAPASTTTPTVTVTAWRTAATSASATTPRATSMTTAPATTSTTATVPTTATTTATASATPRTPAPASRTSTATATACATAPTPARAATTTSTPMPTPCPTPATSAPAVTT
ncbi:MAG: PPC domain-containing protein, partial [Deltaproteobacteria bacterium]|nr:PPC domain-containing protein [Deltaproteobacteria bacterium]